MSFNAANTCTTVMSIHGIDYICIDREVAHREARELADKGLANMLALYAEESTDWRENSELDAYLAPATSNPMAKSLFSAIALGILGF